MQYKLSKKELCYALYGFCLGNGRYQNGWIRIEYTNKQRFYIKWIAKFCRKNNLIFKTKYDFKKKTNYGENMYSAICIKVPDRKHFDKFNRLKNASDYLLRRINLWGLLFWYLDNGNLYVVTDKKTNKTHRFAILNTQRFSYDENVKIKNMFKQRFDIDVKIYEDSLYKNQSKKVYYKIYFNATNFRKFIDLLRDYILFIPKEFYYKFDMKYRLKNLEEFAQRYNFNH